jgi:hypothetical protein
MQGEKNRQQVTLRIVFSACSPFQVVLEQSYNARTLPQTLVQDKDDGFGVGQALLLRSLQGTPTASKITPPPWHNRSKTARASQVRDD